MSNISQNDEDVVGLTGAVVWLQAALMA